jgi:hypothetical protein
MAAFLETIACRGAGLSPGGDTTLARPRPRARFESTIGSPTGLNAMAPACHPADEASGTVAVVPDPHHRLDDPLTTTDKHSHAPAPPRQATPPMRHQAQQAAREAARPMRPQSRAVPPVGAPRASLEPAPASGLSASPIAPPLETVTNRETADFDLPTATPSAQPALVQPVVAVAEAQTQGNSDRSTAARDRLSQLNSAMDMAAEDPIPTSAVQLAMPDPGRPASAEMQRQQVAARSVSVSIGRIDIEVAAPPPTASTPRVQPERTRGFAAYRHARRGRAW